MPVEFAPLAAARPPDTVAKPVCEAVAFTPPVVEAAAPVAALSFSAPAVSVAVSIVASVPLSTATSLVWKSAPLPPMLASQVMAFSFVLWSQLYVIVKSLIIIVPLKIVEEIAVKSTPGPQPHSVSSKSGSVVGQVNFMTVWVGLAETMEAWGA